VSNGIHHRQGTFNESSVHGLLRRLLGQVWIIRSFLPRCWKSCVWGNFLLSLLL